jgi:hypothetical protein
MEEIEFWNRNNKPTGVKQMSDTNEAVTPQQILEAIETTKKRMATDKDNFKKSIETDKDNLKKLKKALAKSLKGL